MEVLHQIENDILIITPLGQSLDAKNAPLYKEEVMKLIETTGKIKLIFDLNQLQFIDSSGLGTFLSLLRFLNAKGGALKLAHLNKPIQTMFEIVSMHRIFDIFPNVKDAINSF